MDEVFNPNQYYIQTTNYFRTMQSSYAELLGLFPPVKADPKTKLKVEKALANGKGLPPLKLRA